MQVKLEQIGNSGSQQVGNSHNLSTGQQNKESGSSDDPLAAIMNQTIFEGKDRKDK